MFSTNCLVASVQYPFGGGLTSSFTWGRSKLLNWTFIAGESVFKIYSSTEPGIDIRFSWLLYWLAGNKFRDFCLQYPSGPHEVIVARVDIGSRCDHLSSLSTQINEEKGGRYVPRHSSQRTFLVCDSAKVKLKGLWKSEETNEFCITIYRCLGTRTRGLGQGDRSV